MFWKSLLSLHLQVDSTKILVSIHQSKQCHITEDRNLHSHGSNNPISCCVDRLMRKVKTDGNKVIS